MTRLAASCLALLVAPAVALGAPDGGPAKSAAPRPRPPELTSPEIRSDRSVTMRLYAPEARVVTVRGQWSKGETGLAKGPDGVWSATVGPVAPGLWEYNFIVDGMPVIDPSNSMLKPQRGIRASQLEIADSPPRTAELQNVPHGSLHIHQYASRTVGRARRVHVYTPPGYEKKTGVRYPVLYLFHGNGDNDAAWSGHGRAHIILDNLIATGKAKPMIVVMTDGHAAPTGSQDKDPQLRFRDNMLAFGRDLVEDVMPLVEGLYRIDGRPQSRAVAGLSMGGGQTLYVGLNHADKFGWVAAMSAAPPSVEDVAGLKDAEGLNKKLRWLWIGCGKDDFLLERVKTFATVLQDKGVKHELVITDGDHSWPVWRGYLEMVVQRLFQAQRS